MQRTFILCIALGSSVLLAGCNEKSSEFYASNPKEALEKMAECSKRDLKNQVSDTDCVNSRNGYAIAYNAMTRIPESEMKAIENMFKPQGAAKK